MQNLFAIFVKLCHCTLLFVYLWKWTKWHVLEIAVLISFIMYIAFCCLNRSKLVTCNQAIVWLSKKKLIYLLTYLLTNNECLWSYTMYVTLHANGGYMFVLFAFRARVASFTLVRKSYIRIGRGFPKDYGASYLATYVLHCTVQF